MSRCSNHINYSFWMLSLLASVCLLSCKKKNTQHNNQENYAKKLERDEISNMQGIINEEKLTILSFRSPHVYVVDVDTPYIEFVGGIKGTFYDKKTNDSAGGIEADYAIYTKELKKMYLKDNVKLINKKGEMLKAKDLWWDQTNQTIYTEKAISFLQGNSLLKGTGLDAKDDMSTYTVHKISGIIDASSF